MVVEGRPAMPQNVMAISLLRPHNENQCASSGLGQQLKSGFVGLFRGFVSLQQSATPLRVSRARLSLP
jgi:hypothetical protein